MYTEPTLPSSNILQTHALISFNTMARSMQKRRPTSRDLTSTSSRLSRESLRTRRSRNICWQALYQQRTRQRSTSHSSKDLARISGWIGKKDNLVCDTLLSKILMQWFNTWKPKHIPLTIYLRHWDNILQSSNYTSTKELV